MKKLTKIRIRLPQEHESWGNLRALADVEIPDKGLEIHGFRVVQQEILSAYEQKIKEGGMLNENGDR